jgi:hypothetical protein
MVSGFTGMPYMAKLNYVFVARYKVILPCLRNEGVQAE